MGKGSKVYLAALHKIWSHDFLKVQNVYLECSFFARDLIPGGDQAIYQYLLSVRGGKIEYSLVY
jgi:hypothetical protein